MNFAVLYVAVPHAETMGYIGMLFLWIFRKTIKSCCLGIRAMQS